MATMRPKRPIASAKMRIRIMPTNSLGSIAFMRTPMSPTTPIAKPEAYINTQKVISNRSSFKRINKNVPAMLGINQSDLPLTSSDIIISKLTRPEKPQQRPETRCLKPWPSVYELLFSTNH